MAKGVLGVQSSINTAMAMRGANASGPASAHTIGDHAKQQITFDPAPLKAVVSKMYRDAGFIGTAYAIRELPSEKISKAGATLQAKASGMDWNDWEPGSPLAESVFKGGKLKGILDDLDITIKNMGTTLTNRIGNAIATAVASGDAVATIRNTLQDSITALSNDPARAQVIATTETNRAYNIAATDQYASAGLTQFTWLAYDGCCPACEDEEADNPHSIGDPTPPEHPNCRCTVLGVVPLS
jgi:SPP1 gp7 family putative phage head morphogenesis protein